MTTANGATTRRTTRTRAATKAAVDDVKTRAASAADVDPKTRQANQARREKVKKDVAEMSIEKATQAVAQAKVRITSTLDQLNEEINGKLEELRQINEAIIVAKGEMQQLHDNDVILSDTADLIERHEQKKTELENEIAEMRAAWEKEQEEHEQAIQERDTELDKSRKREVDEYNFKLGVDRRNEQAQFEETRRQRTAAEQQRKEAFDKSIMEREAAMMTVEQEFIQAKEKAAKLDETSDKLQKAYQEMGSLKRDHKVEIEKLQAQTESQQKLQEQQIAHLNQQIQDRDRQVQALQGELNAARENVKDMAKAAMEAQSGQKALDAVQNSLDKVGSKK
jgi:chromosome segregation ATPase